MPHRVAPLLFLGAVVLPLLRVPGVAAWDTIWLEDGPVFVQQANAANPLSVVFTGYGGYLQLLTRIVAVPTGWMPTSWIAAYLAFSSALICALCAAFVFRGTRGWIATWPFRLLVATMVVLAPAAAIETTATITNSIWTLLAVAPWAFISVRDNRRDVVFRCVVVFFVATATALSAIFVPLAIGVAIARRTRASITVAGMFLIGLVVQLTVVVRSPVAPRGTNSLRIIADYFGLRVLGSFLVGERPLDQLWTSIGEPVVIVAVLVTIGIFVALLPGAGRRVQHMAIILLGYAVVAFAVPTWARGTSAIGFDIGRYTLNMTRYTLTPIVLLVSAVAILVDPLGPQRERRWATTGRKVFLVQTAMVLVIGFITPTVRGDGPNWADESAWVYATECVGAPPEKVVHVTTSPRNFSVALRCDRLSGS